MSIRVLPPAAHPFISAQFGSSQLRYRHSNPLRSELDLSFQLISLAALAFASTTSDADLSTQLRYRHCFLLKSIPLVASQLPPLLSLCGHRHSRLLVAYPVRSSQFLCRRSSRLVPYPFASLHHVSITASTILYQQNLASHVNARRVTSFAASTVLSPQYLDGLTNSFAAFPVASEPWPSFTRRSPAAILFLSIELVSIHASRKGWSAALTTDHQRWHTHRIKNSRLQTCRTCRSSQDAIRATPQRSQPRSTDSQSALAQ